MSYRFNIAYAAGPGDIVNTFKHWQQSEDDPSQVAITYSGQFFELCRRIGARGIAISSNPDKAAITTDQFHVENVPVKADGSGAGFHTLQVRKSVQFLTRARRLGADTFIVSDATGHWFPFSWYKRQHEVFIPSIHCVLWSRFSPLTPVRKILNLLERSFFRRHAAGILCVSSQILSQVNIIAGSRKIPARLFTPAYRPDTFKHISAPPANAAGFNVFYAGRLEKEKGIYDLLQVAISLKKRNISDIRFDILGNGSEEEMLRLKTKQAGVQDIFRIHGYCRRDRVLEALNNSHVVVVPTSTEFHEGFNKVVAEGILSGRPVITSSACPALNCVQEAVMEVPPDDAAGYEHAILQLRDNPDLYQKKRDACKPLGNQFYDHACSWEAGLESILLNG